MFPQLNTWLISGVFLFVATYVIYGGFRSVVGICFFGVLIPATLLITAYFPFQYAHFGNLLPIGDFTVPELFISMRNISLSYLGFELLLFFYPFIHHAKRSQKWAHFGHSVTVMLYLFLAILSFDYFAEPYLLQNQWATLTMWKVVEFSFLARFEYIGVTMWFLVILPIICMWLWLSSRSFKQVFMNVQQKKALWIFVLLIAVCVGFFESREQISILNTISSRFGLYFLGLYIPILYALSFIKKEWRTK